MCSAAFLDAGEHGRVVAHFDIDVSLGCETGLRQRRREQVRPSYDPEDLTLCARGDPGCEMRGGRSVDRPVTAAGNLVQRGARQAPPGRRESRSVIPNGRTDFTRRLRPSIFSSARAMTRWRALAARSSLTS